MRLPTQPFFHGSSILAGEEGAMFCVAPGKGHAFNSPQGTYALYLPTCTTLRVHAEPLEQAGWSCLLFYGEYSSVDRPNKVRLAPVRTTDARLFVEVLTAKLDLPRRPRLLRLDELAHSGPHALQGGEYIRIVGQQSPRPVHFEEADFEGCRLEGQAGRSSVRRPGEFYAVTGFYRPPAAPGVVGYTGPAIVATEIKPEPNGPLRENASHDSWDQDNPERPGMSVAIGAEGRDMLYEQIRSLAFSGQLAEDVRVVAALHGTGAQRSSFHAARTSQLVLATLLQEPAYAPLLGPPIDPGPLWFEDMIGWVRWVLDCSPLPQEPAELLRTLALRIAEVLAEFNMRRAALGAQGVLVHLRRGRATLLSRGVCRAYVIGPSESRLIAREHTLGLDAREQGTDLPDDYPHFWVPLSSFDLRPSTLQMTSCTEVQLQPGERLLLVTGEGLLKALDGPASVARLVSSFPEVAATFPETAEMGKHGWCAVVTEPSEPSVS